MLPSNVGPVSSVRHSGSQYCTIASLPVRWCTGLCLHLVWVLPVQSHTVRPNQRNLYFWSSTDLRSPPGVCVGPILYLVYTSPLRAILHRHGVGFHMYIFNTQLYLSMKTTKVEDVVSSGTRVEGCLCELNKWMLLNNLRLNNGKTELLVLHTKHHPKPPLDSITVGDATVEPTSSTRNIGAVFDDTIGF